MPSHDPLLSELLAEAQAVLARGPHPDRARPDAELLLLHVFAGRDSAKNRAWLLTHFDSTAAPEAIEEFHVLVERRRAGEPIQYIRGEAEFYGLPFYVTRDVLIPRPETEHLVEKAVELLPLFAKPRVLDVGTGSGMIAITIAHEWPSASVTATDISVAALEVARRNALRIGFADRLRFLQGDLLAPVAGEQFHLVLSNPPYVAEGDRTTLAVEVRDYEPAQALFAGDDGLTLYRRLIPAAFVALVPGGYIVLEIGHGQKDAIGALLETAGFNSIEFTADLQGIPRVAAARRP
ncbi:MAG TPA: peptide chain release factor N(5)-glutamine methyltransferase [Terracidiphilus sp.]|nr:peptide chain release factor N(5)-glutamine methyltransferase [Terracidiphilus sp.]